jgi:hypothetical protein
MVSVGITKSVDILTLLRETSQQKDARDALVRIVNEQAAITKAKASNSSQIAPPADQSDEGGTVPSSTGPCS